MIDYEETKRFKARQLRYKKPIVKDINLEKITCDLWDIQEECEAVHWYFDTDDDTLINALDGDEDEAYEFKMMFADLCAECDRMFNDLREEWVPECFDVFFVAAGSGELGGGYLGWDSYEQDYLGISSYEDLFAENEAKKKLRRMTKDDLIDASRQCMRVLYAYIGLRNRYDSLKAAMDILRDKNTAYLQMVKRLDEIYDKSEKDDFWQNSEWKMITDNLPQEAWIM